MTTVATRSAAFDTGRTCAHCGDPLPFVPSGNRPQECDECAEWLNSTYAEDFYQIPDYGGAFDGFTVTSDADPGL